MRPPHSRDLRQKIPSGDVKSWAEMHAGGFSTVLARAAPSPTAIEVFAKPMKGHERSNCL
jgi:hypothetical protein